MPNRSLFLLLSLIAVVATAANAALGGDRKAVKGGYEPIKNLTDPHVVEIAQFAIDKHNKQSGDRLQLVKIVKGEQQLVAGIKYRLVIKAKDGGAERNYKAIVYDRPWGRTLIFFKPLIADAATAASAALGGDRKRIVGGYEPIKNLTDPYVVEIAQFAVDQHNKQSGDHLQLEKIVKGEQQVVAGMNYRLVIKAKHGGAEREYKAIVYNRPWDHFRQLTFFTPLIVGAYEPIKNLKDPYVVEIAQFAVDQHNKQSGDHLQLVKIVKGEQQVVAGMNYRLVIKAKDGGAERKYKAIVYDRPWDHFRQLTFFTPLFIGGYEPIKNLKDPHVVEIAQFAVDQHNKQSGDHLQLVKIVKGERQLVAGFNYRLVIKAKDGGVERNYEAIVYEIPWKNFRQLTSFKPLIADAATAASAALGEDRKRVFGGYEPIKNLTDPHVVEIAQFAVDQHNKQSGDRLQLVKIVKGEQQVVAGMNYRLVIEAKDGGAERNYKAIVYDRPWDKNRKLISLKQMLI